MVRNAEPLERSRQSARLVQDVPQILAFDDAVVTKSQL